MKFSTLLIILCLALVSSSAAFLYYVSVISILTWGAVGTAVIAAYSAGFQSARRMRPHSATARKAVVIAIDRPAPVGPAMVTRSVVR